MPYNILTAIRNIASFSNNNLSNYSSTYLIRINAIGEQLEYYIKDSLAGSFTLHQEEKESAYSKYFSWLGNQNNPPDIVLRDGDAFEIKKIEAPASDLALNSSPPKDRLYSSDSRIANDCRTCESTPWSHKDIFYVIGHIEGSRIKNLFFTQGACYAADKEVYDKVAAPLKDGIVNVIKNAGLEINENTNELGRVNRVDPLGITNLRIRGMWTIKNPIKVFTYIYVPDKSKSFSLAALMEETKYSSFPKDEITALEKGKDILSKKVEIKNPNNPAKRIAARLITLSW